MRGSFLSFATPAAAAYQVTVAPEPAVSLLVAATLVSNVLRSSVTRWRRLET